MQQGTGHLFCFHICRVEHKTYEHSFKATGVRNTSIKRMYSKVKQAIQLNSFTICFMASFLAAS